MDDLTIELKNLASSQGWDQNTYEAADDYLRSLVDGHDDPSPQGLTGRMMSQIQGLANRFALAN